MTISKARRTELEAELLKTMDRLDALKVELREAQRENREQVQLHQKKLLELRDILSGREAEQTSIPGTETGSVKPRKAAPLRKSEAKAMRDAADEFVAKVQARERSPITRWAADARARKVPTFVVEMTGLRTKAQVVAKYGDMQAFEKGKPCPRPLADAAARTRAARKEQPAKTPKAGPAFKDVRWVTQEDGSILGIASDGAVYEIQEVREPFHGFRWVVRGQGRRSGPFPTIAEAQADAVDVDRIRQGQPELPRPDPKEEPKVEPALKWKKNQHGLLQADVPGGFYAFEMHPAGWFNAIWQTATGKRAQLDTNATEDHAKAACAKHHAMRIADMARAAARKAATA